MGTLKDIAGSIVRGLEKMNDNTRRARIREIDQEIYDLQQERNYTLYSLNNPLPNEKPDADFDVRAYRPKPVKFAFGVDSEDGRLVDCKGRVFGDMYSAHPACPYRHERHPAHDFRLKD